ncbi:hypothetical protein DL95DRAFT_408102 [Leptodontidium sp. 2 PMI_412]|nr:hypothetical protein DL95DRAFT_408102 [Leptodontidium sp. 2 PMI_412]
MECIGVDKPSRQSTLEFDGSFRNEPVRISDQNHKLKHSDTSARVETQPDAITSNPRAISTVTPPIITGQVHKPHSQLRGLAPPSCVPEMLSPIDNRVAEIDAKCLPGHGKQTHVPNGDEKNFHPFLPEARQPLAERATWHSCGFHFQRYLYLWRAPLGT